MVQSVVVLTERALSGADAERLVALYGPARPSVRVLVPAGGHPNMLVAVFDHLSLLELREAVGAVRGRPEVTTAEAEADVKASVQELERLGCAASGEVVDGKDPLAAVVTAVQAGAEEVLVVTSPRAVEDTLHQDWASEARERLGVPVLHVYADSSWVG